MREIKFRAWSNGEMQYSNGLTDFGFWKWVVYDSTTNVMQFTGLKDKNGKEIYEGDIVVNDLNSKGVVEYFNNLTWDSGGSLHPGFYCKEWLEWGTDLSYHDSFSDVEIIGNIHQNPDLLTQ